MQQLVSIQMKEANMNVLFDSNVIIDAITQREESNVGAKQLYLKAAAKEINGYLVSKQISDIAYVLRKYLDKDTIKSFCQFLCKAFIVLPFTKEDIEEAVLLNGKDFEDDILIYIAKSNNIEFIATNNFSDYSKSSVKVLKPDDILTRLK